jgi:hypothetical protein
MLILVVGVVGGAGTTTLAHELIRQGKPTVGLDLSDGTLAARIDRRTYPIDSAAFSRRRQQQVIEDIVRQRYTLLWTSACRLRPQRVWALVSAVAQRIDIVADGGLQPPAGGWDLATVKLAVNRESDDPVAAWHEARLRQAHPDVRVVTGDLNAAGKALAVELLPKPERSLQIPFLSR